MRISAQLKKLIKVAKRTDVRSRKDFKKAGFRLREINSGCFRTVYKVKGLPVVIKIPMTSCHHGAAEYRRTQKYIRLKRYTVLRRYVPNIYHYNRKTGITIMHYYNPVPNTNYYTVMIDFIRKMYNDIASPRFGGDIYPPNCGLDSWGNIKVVDWGI